jgi:hypothetical protein
MSDATTTAETEALFALVRQRYGDRLTPEQVDDLKKGVEAIVETARAVRAVRLDNGDGLAMPTPSDT